MKLKHLIGAAVVALIVGALLLPLFLAIRRDITSWRSR